MYLAISSIRDDITILNLIERMLVFLVKVVNRSYIDVTRIMCCIRLTTVFLDECMYVYNTIYIVMY